MSRRRVEIAGKLRHVASWRPNPPDHRDFIMKAPHFGGAPIPARTDLSGQMGAVNDQGDIGSCVWNATTDAAEYLLRRAGKPVSELSRLFGYYVTRVRIEKASADEDSGCFIRDAMRAATSFGICHETTWPYDDPTKRYSLEPSQAAFAEAALHKVHEWYMTPNVDAIRYSLAQGFPVVIGFSLFSSAASDAVAESGLLPMPGDDDGFLGGHAVLITGHDDKAKIFDFKNSWGTKWGVQGVRPGFGRMPYAMVDQKLALDGSSLRVEQ